MKFENLSKLENIDIVEVAEVMLQEVASEIKGEKILGYEMFYDVDFLKQVGAESRYQVRRVYVDNTKNICGPTHEETARIVNESIRRLHMQDPLTNWSAMINIVNEEVGFEKEEDGKSIQISVDPRRQQELIEDVENG